MKKEAKVAQEGRKKFRHIHSRIIDGKLLEIPHVSQE